MKKKTFNTLGIILLSLNFCCETLHTLSCLSDGQKEINDLSVCMCWRIYLSICKAYYSTGTSENVHTGERMGLCIHYILQEHSRS